MKFSVSGSPKAHYRRNLSELVGPITDIRTTYSYFNANDEELTLKWEAIGEKTVYYNC